jgi:hypothetical protein
MMGKGVSKTAEQYVRYEYVSFSAQNKSSTPVNKQLSEIVESPNLS